MQTIEKVFQAFSEDVNREESEILNRFEKITKVFFQGTLWTGIPLMFYLIYELIKGF